MYENIEDLPTTLRETLSEATLNLYLKVYREAYEAPSPDEVEQVSRASLAHREAMRAVKRDSVYDQEVGKRILKGKSEGAERNRGVVEETGMPPELQQVRSIPTAREAELLTREVEPQHGYPVLHWQGQTVDLAWFENAVVAALGELEEEDVVERIWNHDHTLWKSDPAEITKTFGTLIHAQALGDQKALEDAERQVIRLHLGEPVVANIERLAHLIEEEAV